MKATAPAFAEFKETVRAKFYALNAGQDQADKEKFFEGKEVLAWLEQDYRENLRKFEAGEINREEFLGEGAAAVAYCCYLEF